MGQYLPHGDPMPCYGDPVVLPITFYDPPPPGRLPDVAMAKWDGLISDDSKAAPEIRNVVATRIRHEAGFLLAMLGVDRTKWRAIGFGDALDQQIDRAIVIGDYGSYAARDPEWFYTLRRMATQVVYL